MAILRPHRVGSGRLDAHPGLDLGVRHNGALPEGLKGGVLGSNLTSYAWLWLVVGVVLLVSSFLILIRSLT